MSPTARARLVRRIVTYFPVTMICFAFALVVGGAAFYYVQRTSDRLEANRHHDDARALRDRQLADRKFQQAVRISTRQTAYSVNKSVCLLRLISQQQIKRLETTKPAGYKAAEAFWAQIRDNQIPVPPSLDCSKLPSKPPQAVGA